MDCELPLPTIPGKTTGIVGWDPCQIQCGICGLVETQDRRSVATWITLSGSRFCETVPGVRHCRSCYAEHAKACHRDHS
jgi:hypothetical protein